MPLNFSPAARRLLVSDVLPHRRRSHPMAPDASRKILVVNGHPDPSPDRFCAALWAAYCEGARSAGWAVETLALGKSPDGANEAAADMREIAQRCALLDRCDSLAVFFPLWLDQPPPDVKDFLEMAARRARASAAERRGRLFVTMGMPAFLHRQMYRAREGLYAAGNAMHLPGFAARDPVFIGSVDALLPEQRQDWLKTLHGFGREGF